MRRRHSFTLALASALFASLALSPRAHAICRIPEATMVCDAVPLGETCYVGHVDSRDTLQLELTLSGVVGDNPAGLVAGDPLTLAISDAYLPFGDRVEPGERALVCASGESLSYEKPLSEEGELAMPGYPSVAPETAAAAFLADDQADCFALYPPPSGECNDTAGCNHAGETPALALGALLLLMVRRRRG